MVDREESPCKTEKGMRGGVRFAGPQKLDPLEKEGLGQGAYKLGAALQPWWKKKKKGEPPWKSLERGRAPPSKSEACVHLETGGGTSRGGNSNTKSSKLGGGDSFSAIERVHKVQGKRMLRGHEFIINLSLYPRPGKKMSQRREVEETSKEKKGTLKVKRGAER